MNPALDTYESKLHTCIILYKNYSLLSVCKMRLCKSFHGYADATLVLPSKPRLHTVCNYATLDPFSVACANSQTVAFSKCPSRSQTRVSVPFADLPCQVLFTQTAAAPQQSMWCLTFWSGNYFFNFRTPCIQNVNNTGTKYVRIMKQTAFLREKTESIYHV